MRSDLNREGLTFEEWLCAAGLARIEYDRVLPYTESSTSYKQATWVPAESLQTTLLLLCDNIPRREQKIRRTVTHYSAAVRKAWKDGEDPTEHRAALKNKRSGVPATA